MTDAQARLAKAKSDAKDTEAVKTAQAKVKEAQDALDQAKTILAKAQADLKQAQTVEAQAKSDYETAKARSRRPSRPPTRSMTTIPARPV